MGIHAFGQRGFIGVSPGVSSNQQTNEAAGFASAEPERSAMLELSDSKLNFRFRVASGKAKVLSACAMVTLMCWALMSLAACGSESSASSSSLDTDENRALLAQSGLIRDFASSDTEQIITAPWIAIEHVQDEDAGDVWRIVGSSEQELSADALSNMSYLAVITWGDITATYKSSAGNTTTGSSEYAEIVYYDAATGVGCGKERIKAKELPDSTTSTPHYTIEDSDVVSCIDARVSSGYGPSYSPDTYTVEDGALVAVNAEGLNEQSIVSIPEGVTQIAPEALDNLARYHKMKLLRLPKSLTAIDGEIRIDDAGGFSYQDPVLAVYDDSYALQYAQDGGYVYGLRGTTEAYVPDGVEELDKVHYDYTTLKSYIYLHVPESVTAIRDGAIGADRIVVVAPDSYAQKAAKQYGHYWCLEGHLDEVFVPSGNTFFPSLYDDVLPGITKIHVPASVNTIRDEMDECMQAHKDGVTLYVEKGSFAEKYAKDNGIAYEIE